jgi:hypothetical protein
MRYGRDFETTIPGIIDAITGFLDGAGDVSRRIESKEGNPQSLPA